MNDNDVNGNGNGNGEEPFDFLDFLLTALNFLLAMFTGFGQFFGFLNFFLAFL